MPAPSRPKTALLVSALAVAGLLLVIVLRPGPPRGIVRTEAPVDFGAPIAKPIDDRPPPPGAVARLGIRRGDILAGRGEIESASYSADGTTIATAEPEQYGVARTYRLWNAATGAALARDVPPSKVPYGESHSPGGLRVAWSTHQGNFMFSPQGLVEGVDSYRTVTVVDASTGKLINTLDQWGGRPDNFAVSGDGATVILSNQRISHHEYVTGGERRIEIWDVDTGRPRSGSAEWWAATRRVPGLALSHDGKSFAYTMGKRLVLADAETGIARWCLDIPRGDWNSVAFSRAGDLLLAMPVDNNADIDRTMLLLDAETGRTVRALDGAAGTGYQNCAAFSPDCKRIATWGHDSPFRIWDVATGGLLPAFEGHRAPIRALAVNRDGSVVVAADTLSAVCVWDAKAGTLHRRLDARHAGTFGFRESRPVSAGSDGVATDLLDRIAYSRPIFGNFYPVVTAISRDGRLIAAGSADGMIRITDAADGQALHTLTGHTGMLSTLEFSTDGRRLLSAARGSVDVPDKRETRPKGRIIDEYKSDVSIRVWDVRSGKELRKWEQSPARVALSSDGRTMISGGAFGRIARMDVATGRVLPPLDLHKGFITALATGTGQAASADADGIAVWDLRTEKILRRFVPDHGSTSALAFSGDGRWLCSGGADGTILVWKIAAK